MVAAQTGAPAPPSRATVVQAAREVTAKARYCSMITVGLDGELQARVVDPFAPEDDLEIWIGTNRQTRKVAEVKKDPRTTLVCFDPGDQAYVTWIGRSDVVDDPTDKARHWKTEWTAFYKDGYGGPEYLLIRFRPRRIEIVSPSHKLMNDPVTWKPVSVAIE
jgi:general stress protein 26